MFQALPLHRTSVAAACVQPGWVSVGRRPGSRALTDQRSRGLGPGRYTVSGDGKEGRRLKAGAATLHMVATPWSHAGVPLELAIRRHAEP